MRWKIERRPGIAQTQLTILLPDEPEPEAEALLRFLKKHVRKLTGVLEGYTVKIAPEEICYIESVDDRTFLYADRAVYESPQRLYQLEQTLANTSFVRVSKSVILNADKVEKVRPLLNGKLEALLSNGERQHINRHYVSSFRAKFEI